MNTLLILSAKNISNEMSDSFGSIPSVLIPYKGKPLLEHIYIDNYDTYDNIIVVAKENAHKIEEYVSNNKILSNIEIIILNELKDIGFTLLKALETIDIKNIKNLTINFGDTYYNSNLSSLMNSNSIVYFKSQSDYKWDYIRQIENGIIKVYSKENFSDEKENIIIGIFNFTNVPELYKLLCNIISTNEYKKDTFYESIELYSYFEKFTLVNSENNWIDLGHHKDFFSTYKDVEARAFNKIYIDRDKGILKKYSTDKEKFINEIMWYSKIPNELQYITPRIFDSNTSYDNPYIEMEYYSYPTLHDAYVYGDLDLYSWNKIFNKLLNLNSEMTNYKLDIPNTKIKSSLKNMYIDKTSQRLNKIKYNNKFNLFFKDKVLINNFEYSGLNFILNKLESIVNNNILVDFEQFNIIHGDYFFANILYDTRNEIVRLIDPRGDFGGYGIYGDNSYELAKLMHSINGCYDLIIEDIFDINIQDDSISYRILINEKQKKIRDMFFKILIERNYKVKKIELIEALLFLSMVPLHYDNYERQLVMLCVGIEKINKFL